MSNSSPRGFTLLELLAVVAIIALLLSITFVSIDYFKARARDTKRLANIDALKKALNLYQTTQNQKYPVVKVSNIAAEICVTGVYTRKNDPSNDPLIEQFKDASIDLQPIADPLWPEIKPANPADKAGHCYTYYSPDGLSYTLGYYLELGIQGKKSKHNTETH